MKFRNISPILKLGLIYFAPDIKKNETKIIDEIGSLSEIIYLPKLNKSMARLGRAYPRKTVVRVPAYHIVPQCGS